MCWPQLNLSATPSGGIFSGVGVSGNTFNSSSAGAGTFVLSYANGCVNSATLGVNVNACLGITEFKDPENHLNIFPNPSAGELEIKGTKEEAIFITNELGQLIATKNLSQENNYSVKLNNLQSGVYFVGNKFSRQKVVVIK